jgi:DNA primase catalytic subunit
MNNGDKSPISFREQRIRKITHLYYSRSDIQKAIFEFSKNREICPRYFEGFGKRPDSFQYIGDIFELVRKGATSFHCSEELWEDPLKISTGMNENQANEIRTGFDLLIDIDCKWFDYSKLAAKAIINVLRKHGVKNIGVKFSGSKGWHILIPWKSFPKEINEVKTSNMFPELPRKIVNYIRFEAEKELKKILPGDFEEQFKGTNIKRGIKCNKCSEVANEYELTSFFCEKCKIGEERRLEKGSKENFKCPICEEDFSDRNSIPFYECNKCRVNSKENLNNFSKTSEEIDIFEVMGLDIVLVSPRHLFRMPYSLHEKTALASIVLNPNEITDFQLKDADPVKVKVRDFMPLVEENEAKELLMQALDWAKEVQISRGETEEKIAGKYAEYKPIKLNNLSEKDFPPCIKKILQGIIDGKKRALFILINLFRSISMDKDEMEKRIKDWNKKNNPSLKEGYIKSQLSWSYRKKPIMPSNCKEFYQGIGVCLPDDLCRLIKNPVNYIIRKNFQANKSNKKFIKKQV